MEKQCGYVPETVPVPLGREESAHRHDRTHRLIGLGVGIDYKFQLFDIVVDLIHGSFEAVGYSLPEEKRRSVSG